ncbi:hypothetical protein D4R42_04400 [bacterium]|nr:MAG: hypothetical protein D4R42_04400 [bacterium]
MEPHNHAPHPLYIENRILCSRSIIMFIIYLDNILMGDARDGLRVELCMLDLESQEGCNSRRDST